MVAQLRIPAGIAGGPALREQTCRLQLGKFGEPGLDQRMERSESTSSGRTGAVAGPQRLKRRIEQAGLKPAIHRRTADARASGGLTAGAAGLGKQMS